MPQIIHSKETEQVRDWTLKEGLEGLTPARIATLYRRAPLWRPVARQKDLWEMFERSSLVLTVWNENRLVGIARVLSDGVLYSVLCDLAVEPDFQRHGIGKMLIREVIDRCEGTDLILRDSDISSEFYERLGFNRVNNAWVWGGGRLP